METEEKKSFEPILSSGHSSLHHHSGSSSSSSHHHHHHSSRKKHKRKKRIKRILIAVACVLISLILITAGTVVYFVYSGERELKNHDFKLATPEIENVVNDGNYVIYKGERYQYNEDIVNLLFMGIDEDNWSGDYGTGIGNNGSADVIALAAIDTKNSKMTMINIPRDIMTDIKTYSKTGGYSGMQKLQICLSYAYGDGADTSCINTTDAVRGLFYNIPISSYFSLKIAGVGFINDSVGGVTVKSPETIGEFVEGEEYHLEGEQATHFIQKRSMDVKNANLLRNERQKVYLQAFMSKMISQTKKNLKVPIDLYNASAPFSCTNLSSTKISYLASLFVTKSGMKTEMKSVPVDVKQVDNHAENYVREEEFYDMFIHTFYEKVGK